ncbi:MAG: trypsin-like peptidase domain-containing protein [Actinomycetia bacterium]|nr:trypsin-like peptidase domain-containing protein [Actinomycetes bacterium]
MNATPVADAVSKKTAKPSSSAGTSSYGRNTPSRRSGSEARKSTPVRPVVVPSGTTAVGTGMLRRLSIKRRKGGVAPFVPPSSRLGRIRALHRFRRQGFVPLSPGKPRLHHRILPRTVIGISFMLLSVAIGAAFSGAAFYAYYDNRLAANEEAIARFVEGFDQQFADAAGTLDELRTDSIDDIRAELAPLGDYVSDANGVVSLPATVGPSVWTVETRDEAGASVLAASFAVAAHRGGTAFITSFRPVAASTVAPAPLIELVKGDRRLAATLWAWDAEADLALLVVDTEVPTLSLATDDQQVGAVGGRLFAMSGVGGQGAAASPGVLLDHSAQGLQHTAAVGTLYQGGPLVTGDGVVVGVASLGYHPYGVDQGQVMAAPDIAVLCRQILSCAESSTALVASIDDGSTEADSTGTGPETDTSTGEATSEG